jgi:hypothetical protein
MASGGVVRAGAEMGLAEPAGEHEAVGIIGRLFVEFADGRRVRATGGNVGARFGRVAGQPVTREDAVGSILSLVGKVPDERPPRLAWEQLSEDLKREGVVIGDEELAELPFTVELSDEILEALAAQ